MDNTWELIDIVERSIDYAFDGKIRLNMYEYLKSIKATRGDTERFLESETAKSINLMIYDLEEYIEGGSDEIHKQLREAYGHLGKPEARKIKNFLDSLIVDAGKYGHEKRSRRRRKSSK